MLNTIRGRRGMVVAPHALAAQAGLDVLRDGGNAIEAAIATAASLAVVYPHMTGIGGDAFWLVRAPGQKPVFIDACGAAALRATPAFYAEQGLGEIPTRGPLACLTTAGAVSAWDAAERLSRTAWGGRLPLGRLLEDATEQARQGYPVTASQARTTAARREELGAVPGFADTFLAPEGARAAGTLECQPRLAATLEQLARAGADDFYRGELAAALAADLDAVGSPLGLADLEAHRAVCADPLSVELACGRVYNAPPPTQGVASLMILALFERMGGADVAPDGADHLHRLVEATKMAFRMRDRHVRDPRDMDVDPASLLEDAALDRLAQGFDPDHAAPWGGAGDMGDTTWFGVIDGEGRAVSAIQSIYHEYGSGVVLPRTGVIWQNRGLAFALDSASPRALRPGRKPFHTLNPAMAELSDGRLMVYGTMGGDGQPQTQAAVFSRYAIHGQALQAAVTAPRWLLGRTWGSHSNTLKLESRFPEEVLRALGGKGHDLEVVQAFDEMMGHAGAIVRDPQGVLAGAADPRGDGLVAAF
ncbi:MAG: gamma-glutamyltransferase family protein [Pseudomonadota bacterium]